MKKTWIVIAVITAAVVATMIFRPIRSFATALWDNHAIIGGMSGSDGIAVKVDSDGKVYVNMSGMDLLYTGVLRGGVSTIASTVSKLTSTNLAFAILKLSGADKTFSIANGTNDGQSLTLVKDEYDARTLKLDLTIDNPNTTHTGFSSITWPSEAGSFVTLAWIDSTTGWIITGQSGVTITY